MKRGKKGKEALGETLAFVAGRFIINGLVFFVSQHGQVAHRVVKNNLRLCVEKATTEPRLFPNQEKRKENFVIAKRRSRTNYSRIGREIGRQSLVVRFVGVNLKRRVDEKSFGDQRTATQLF